MKRYQNVLILSVVWAFYYVAAGVCNKSLSSFVTGSCIRILTFVLLTVSMGTQGTLKDLKKVSGVWPKLLLVGCFGFLLDITAFIGLRYSSSAIGTALLKTDVLMVNFASMFLFGMRFSKRDWLLTGTTLAGVVVLLKINPFSANVVPTDIFFLLSAGFVTANALLIKHIQTRHNVSDYVIAYYNNLVTMLWFLLATVISGAGRTAVGAIADGGLGLWLVLGGIGQFFIYHFYYRSLRALPVWIVKVILLLIPLFSMVAEWLLFGQRIDGQQMLGGGIVIASAAFLILEQRRKAAVKQ